VLVHDLDLDERGVVVDRGAPHGAGRQVEPEWKAEPVGRLTVVRFDVLSVLEKGGDGVYRNTSNTTPVEAADARPAGASSTVVMAILWPC